jgi:flagellar hook-associated protein FlgK
MPNFSLGLSALRTSQYALGVVSNNIANANTDGYHRRNVHLEELLPNELNGFRIGNGVSINYIERVRDQVTEASLTNVISDSSNVDQLLRLERQIEAAFLNGNASIGGELDQFFAEITKLTSAPDEPAQRAAVIESAQRLAGIIRQAADSLAELKSAIQFQVEQEMDTLNAKMKVLNDLSVEIQKLTAQGKQPNTEMDQRDELLNEIAELVGVSRRDHLAGELNLRIGHHSIQQGGSVNQFSLTELSTGELAVLLDDSDRPVDLESGRIVALLEVYNSTVPTYASKLDELANGLMQKIDSIHATGIGTDGSFQHLVGTRAVDLIDRPLAESGTAFAIEPGELTVTIVDGDVLRTEFITIDPTSESLEDVAAKLSGIDGLFASINPNTNQLQLSAAQGLSFDFSGRVETHPRLDSFAGSSVPTFGGTYTGSANEQLTFQIVGTGEVGISENLYVDVYAEQGFLKQRIEIGRGYEAGTPIEIGDGVQLSLARGSVTDGDQFTTRVTAQADETGMLAALGLNSFFRGINAHTMHVDASVLESHGRFAAGKSGDAADTENLFRFADLEYDGTLPGNLTFAQYTNEINTEIGFQINSHTALSNSLDALHLRLEQDRDAYSGVDLNEEMVYLQQFQKSYEAAVRVIQTMDDMLSELFNIIR